MDTVGETKKHGKDKNERKLAVIKHWYKIYMNSTIKRSFVITVFLKESTI